MTERELLIRTGNHAFSVVIVGEGMATVRVKGPETGNRDDFSETEEIPAAELAAHLRECADFLDRAASKKR